jgi:hypothetical protein
MLVLPPFLRVRAMKLFLPASQTLKLTMLSLLLWITAPALPGQTIQNFKIDPDPVTFNGTSYFVGARAEKVVDFFTSTTTPSVVLGMNGSPGGLWFYQSTGGLGGWGNNPSTITNTLGAYYERAKSIRLPGRSWPDLVVSAPGVNGATAGSTILFLNPLNPGGNGNPSEVWQQIYINSKGGCHDIKLADMNGDGLLDVICTGAVYLPGSQPFIAYQTSNLAVWNVVNSTTTQINIGDGVAIWANNGINNVIGSTGSSTYIYENPLNFGGNPLTAVWPGFPIGPGATGNSLGTLPNNMGVIVADSEEGTTEPPWTYGLVQFAPPASNVFSSAWRLTVIDDTVRTAHEINAGTLPWNSQVYALFAEQEQRSAHCNTNGYFSAPDIGACRVGYYTYSNGEWSASPVIFSTYGTQNQSVIDYNGGLVVASANYGTSGAIDKALQIWEVTNGSGGGGGGGGGGGTAVNMTVADPQGFFWDAGNSKYGGTILQVYQDYPGPQQDWAWTPVTGGFHVCSIGVCLSDNGSQVVMGSKADVITILNTGAVIDVTTGRYVQNPANPANGSYLATGPTASIWTYSHTLH